MKEILDKLKHIKSENFTQEAEEAILKEFIFRLLKNVYY